MRLRDVKVGMKVLFEDEEATVESKDTCATYAVKIVTENGRRSWVKHRWLRKVPAKKSPEVGSAEWAEEMGKQGKRVRADYWHPTCFITFVNDKWKDNKGNSDMPPVRYIAGAEWSLFEEPAAEQPKPAPTFKVGDVVDCDGSYTSGAKVIAGEVEAIVGDGIQVKGKWSDGREWRVCLPHQVRHHVAKEEAKTAPHVVPIAANIRDAIEAMKRVKVMAEIEIGRLEALLDIPSKPTQT